MPHIGDFKNLFTSILNRWNSYVRNILVIPHIRKSIGNSNINQSFLCNNCTGAMMMHDMGCRFDSPTVNLWMTPKDFLYLINNIRFLSKSDIVDVTPPNSNYPIGRLGECTIHFLHYKSFTEAICCWKRRMKRLDIDNMYLILIETNPCPKEIEEFSKLSFKKVALLRSETSDIQCAFKIDYPSNRKDFKITDYSDLKGQRYYDQFDFVSFFKKR